MSERKAQRTAVVRNSLGMHLRPWGQFAELANRFIAQVRVTKGGTRADGRSPMDLLTLAACSGAELQIEAEGPDADAAVAALGEFIENLIEDIESAEQNLPG